ncbi:hypothetical protein I350_00049 [Cryptococcus amylolentus CBS 6273]|uniref:Uncharacterized protein n=1 Tax=Cryptococcus amylolentus CBS 6273 TaxID=1296118 RepID=A0A1E3KDU3_9TREE|nr:hypothetical protein I350_00049 [Cryptococcus amylolentus CBS 6273]
MSSITPATFAALHPVHHLIFDELVASAPHSVLRLCSSTYKRGIPLLYADIYPSHAVFEGLRWDSEDERTLEALQNTRTLRICDFASLDTLYELAGQEPASRMIEDSPRYPYVYGTIFPNLERIEFGFPVLRKRVDNFFRPLLSQEAWEEAWDQAGIFPGVIPGLLPSNLREVVFHLDEEGEEYWNQARVFLDTLAPREAVILIRGKVLNRAHTVADDGNGAERLRVFVVGSQEGWDSLDDDETEEGQTYIWPMAAAVDIFAINLHDELVERGWTLGSGQEVPKSIPRVEINLPERDCVVEWVDDDVREQLEALREEGMLVLEELDTEVVDKLGVMDWAGVA